MPNSWSCEGQEVPNWVCGVCQDWEVVIPLRWVLGEKEAPNHDSNDSRRSYNLQQLILFFDCLPEMPLTLSRLGVSLCPVDGVL